MELTRVTKLSSQERIYSLASALLAASIGLDAERALKLASKIVPLYVRLQEAVEAEVKHD